MRAMKDRAIVCNIATSTTIKVAGLKNLKWNNIKPQVDEIASRTARHHSLSEGLVNLGNAGPPELRDVGVVHQPDLAQINCYQPRLREEGVHTQALDEKVARLHLAKSAPSHQSCAPTIPGHRRPADRPFKSDHYRY